tara:strand:- start:173 stop:343 length:171 start_codon:yes stop_codon:yes gene_type:complete
MDNNQVKFNELIEEYLADISPLEVIEEEDVVALEEIRDMIVELIVSNNELKSLLKI